MWIFNATLSRVEKHKHGLKKTKQKQKHQNKKESST